jgi:PIN domain nuclease of toxin-antitoxin system
MKLLLDTHSLLWWATDRARLSPAALAACKDLSNTLMLSVVSAWEMQIKAQLSKLTLLIPLATMIDRELNVNGLTLLRVELAHVLALDTLPLHHKDPFDRLLIAQAQVEGATLVSSDPLFTRYGITLLW